MSWLSSIIPGSSAVWLGVAIWTAVVAWGASRVTQWVTPEPEAPPPDTIYAEGPLQLPDLPEPTTPDQVTEYDSSDTQTQCVQVPTWLANTTPPTGNSTPSTTRQDGSLGEIEASPLATTPLINGSPPISVTPDAVTFSSYVRGQGRTWMYDVPQEAWSIGVDGALTASGQWLHAATTLEASHTTEWGPMDVEPRIGAGYGALVTDNTYHAGPVVRAGLSITYRW